MNFIPEPTNTGTGDDKYGDRREKKARKERRKGEYGEGQERAGKRKEEYFKILPHSAQWPNS